MHEVACAWVSCIINTRFLSPFTKIFGYCTVSVSFFIDIDKHSKLILFYAFDLYIVILAFISEENYLNLILLEPM